VQKFETWGAGVTELLLKESELKSSVVNTLIFIKILRLSNNYYVNIPKER